MWDKEIEIIFNAIDAAKEVSMPRFINRDFSVTTKPDITPVTEADQLTEKAVNEVILSAFPNDSIFGEEGGWQNSESNSRKWIIDPIDGTKNFIRGTDFWATLIALEVDGELVAGAVAAHALDKIWWAKKDEGAYHEKKKLSVSKVEKIEDAFLGLTDPSKGAEDVSRKMNELSFDAWHSRGFGDFYTHMLVAQGVMDVGFDPKVEVYDVAPVALIVREAGGRFTSTSGDDTHWGGSGLSSNGLLHDEVLNALK